MGATDDHDHKSNRDHDHSHREPDSNKLIAILGIVGAVITLIAALIGVLPFLLNLADVPQANIGEGLDATQDDPATAAPAESAPLTISHDFTNGMGDLSLNSECQSSIEGGVLQLSSSQNGTCSLALGSGFALDQLGYAQADLLALSATNGTSAVHGLELSVQTQAGAWSVMCGMQWGANSGHQLVMRVLGPNAHIESEGVVSSLPDTWYTMRLEIDPETTELRCLTNGRLLKAYTPTNAADLRSLDTYTLKILTTWNAAVMFWDDAIFVGND